MAPPAPRGLTSARFLGCSRGHRASSTFCNSLAGEDRWQGAAFCVTLEGSTGSRRRIRWRRDRFGRTRRRRSQSPTNQRDRCPIIRSRKAEPASRCRRRARNPERVHRKRRKLEPHLAAARRNRHPQRSNRGASQRNVVVFLPGVLELLVAQHGEGARKALAGRVRHDHLIDIAAFGGDEGR